jgi:hypothetical protein
MARSVTNIEVSCGLKKGERGLKISVEREKNT